MYYLRDFYLLDNQLTDYDITMGFDGLLSDPRWQLGALCNDIWMRYWPIGETSEVQGL